MTANELLKDIENRLDCDNKSFEAKQILYFVTTLSPTDYILHKNDAVSDEAVKNAADICKRRACGEPLYYILGECEFYSLEFSVGEGVLIPRADTEILVDFALQSIENIKNARVLDLCSGSGCIAIALAKNRPDITVDAVELYDKAFSYLEKNILRNSAKNVTALKEDALKFVGDYDLVISNPPYINFSDEASLQKEVGFEPRTALFAENDGYYFYETIAQNFAEKKNFTLMFEVGFQMDGKTTEILMQNGYKGVEVIKDLNHIPRVVSAYK